MYESLISLGLHAVKDVGMIKRAELEFRHLLPKLWTKEPYAQLVFSPYQPRFSCSDLILFFTILNYKFPKWFCEIQSGGDM